MLSIFIPVYNEEAILEANVRRVLETLREYDLELFIVDDGSTDGSPRIGRQLAASEQRVRYVRYDNGPTRRENLAAAFSKASGELVGFTDADLSAGPEHIPRMIELLKSSDIVISSKYLPGSKTRRRLHRRLFSHVANVFIRIYFGSKLSDHQCGLKMFRKGVLSALVRDAGYDSTLRRGFSWDTEILLRAQKRGYSIAEVPVNWVESKKSSVRMLREIRMIPYILGLRGRL